MTSQSTHLPIPEDQIDVWYANLDAASCLKGTSDDVLCAEERDRADKFRAVADRHHFIASRVILRTLIGRYLDTAPRSISFSYGAYGKPAVSGFGLHFNLSHSHGRGLFAFSSQSELGVDLELVRTLPDLPQVGASIFSLAEAQQFETIPLRDQASAFFKCWTRKEALIKALGCGLSYPMEQFSISFGEPACLLSAEGCPTELSLWHLHHLEPEPDFFAAIATQQQGSKIVTRRLH